MSEEKVNKNTTNKIKQTKTQISSKPKTSNKNSTKNANSKSNQKNKVENKQTSSVEEININNTNKTEDNKINQESLTKQTNSVETQEVKQNNSNTETKTQNGFVKFLKSFTPYQIIYLLSVVVLVTLFSIFLPDEMLETDNTFVIICSVVAVIANPVCELMISKQNKWNFIVSIIFIEITESILYFSLGAYSVAIISLVFWIPIDLVSFFKWKEHPDAEEEIVTEVKRLNWWQDILIVLAICAFGFGVGFLLTLIPGATETYPEPFFNYLDAFISAVGMANGILLLVRYNEQWYAWGLTLILDAVLYIYTGSYIMLITVAAMMINTIYGFVKWLIYIKKHKTEEKNTIALEKTE